MDQRMTAVDPAEVDQAGPRSWRGTLPALARLALGAILIGAAAVGLCCLAGVLGALAIYARGGLDGLLDFYQELRFDDPLKTLLGAVFVSVLYVGVACATIGGALWRDRRGWTRRLALRSALWRRRATLAIAATTLAYAATASLVMSLSRDHRTIVSGQTDIALLAILTANLVILAPIAEELFFRGWLYTGLRARLPFWPSFLLTTSCFAAIHWDAGHRRILLVLPLAVALGLLREAAGSIKPTILLHAVYNLIIVAITLLET